MDDEKQLRDLLLPGVAHLATRQDGVSIDLEWIDGKLYLVGARPADPGPEMKTAIGFGMEPGSVEWKVDFQARVSTFWRSLMDYFDFFDAERALARQGAA